MHILKDVQSSADNGRVRRLARFLRTSWAIRSLALGAVAAACDYTVLILCAFVLDLPSAVAAMCGLAVGATLNFLLNRNYAFRDCQSTLAATALRYAAAIACLMVLHAPAVGMLTDRLELPIVVSKLIADVTLLAGGQLLLLRYVVFPRNKGAVEVA